MITTPHHPQIQELLNISKASSKLFFSYNTSYLNFLKAFISDKLSRNETIVISTDKTEDVSFLLDKSSVFYPFTHVFDKYILPAQTVSKIRVRAKKNVNLLHIIDHEQIENQINALVHDISLIYSNNYGLDQNNIKLPALLQQLLHSKIDYHLPILEYYLPSYIFDYSKSELLELNRLVNWSSLSYKQNFNSFSRVLPSVTAELQIEQFLSLAEQQLSKANELSLLFLNNLNHFKTDQSRDLEEKKIKALSLIDRIRSIREKSNRINKPYTSPKANTLFSKIASSVNSKQINPAYQESMEIDFDKWIEDFKISFPSLYQEFYMLEESTLEPNIHTAEKILAKELEQINAQCNQAKNARLEQLNIHNCPQIFKSIYEELNKFYGEMQESPIISVGHDDRSFNLINNYEFLLQIRNQLHDVCQLISNNPDYYNWLQKVNSCTKKERLVLDTFIQFFPKSEEWSEIFENYYFHSSVKTKHSHATGLEKKLEDLKSLQKKYHNLSSESIDSVCNKEFYKHLSELKKNQSEVYKSFIKKKYDANNQNFKNGGNLPLLKKFFPISIVKKDDIDSIHNSSEWDFHIHLDSSKFEINKTPISQLGTKYIYIKHPVDDYHLSGHLKEENSYWIKHDMKEYIKHPKLQTDQDQLNFARSLSSKLEDYLDRIQIFQIEGHYIISFLDKKVLGIFLHMYEKYSIKKFVIDHDLNYSLSDILLAGVDNITVLIQDHLLNPYEFSTFQWQRYVIELMSRAGLDCKDISYAHVINKNYEQLQIPIQTRYSVDRSELASQETVIQGVD